MQFRRQSNGQIITLDPTSVLGAGGEARVYSLAKDAQLVAKIYHQPSHTSARKLAVMIANPPEDGELGEGLKSIAWPVDLLVPINGNQDAVGYLMPRVSGMRRIADFYNPKIRKQHTPLFNYLYLHRAARNLSAAMHALHTRGYLVGDVNESNILISETALVMIVDTDSFQVRDEQSGQVFRCAVGKPEFTPPELQHQSLDEVNRLPEHDLFGLAVLIFHLLMEGAHPFAGVYHGDDEPPSYETRIASGYFPYGKKPAPFTPAPVTPRFEILNPHLQRLFARCFDDGHENPTARPLAIEWREALTAAENSLTVCQVNDQHRYGNHLPVCPWCERAKLLNGRDPFPSRRAVQNGRHNPPIPNTTTPTTSATIPLQTTVQMQSGKVNYFPKIVSLAMVLLILLSIIFYVLMLIAPE